MTDIQTLISRIENAKSRIEISVRALEHRINKIPEPNTQDTQTIKNIRQELDSIIGDLENLTEGNSSNGTN